MICVRPERTQQAFSASPGGAVSLEARYYAPSHS